MYNDVGIARSGGCGPRSRKGMRRWVLKCTS